jgi:aldose 1-epimerase
MATAAGGVDFGKLPDGRSAKLYTLKCGETTVKLTDYGARIVEVNVPDRNGKLANVVLGFDSVEKYVKHSAYFGCTTGRFANRIAGGKFTLEGKEYALATNNGPNHLHGGKEGFDRKLWKTVEVARDGSKVVFELTSPDGDEGYPGELKTVVAYTFDGSTKLTIEYSASVAGKATVLNLTNHAYWNLAGEGDVLDHEVLIDAFAYVEPNDALIPTGKLAPLEGTPLDFTKSTKIGARIAKMKEGVPPPGGYDHCYAIRPKKSLLAFCARVRDPKSGRTMEIETTEPGVQFYTGNFLDGSADNGGYKQHGAFCLETQHYPDSPNQPNFPSTVLKPGDTYRQTTVHRFSAE